MKEYLKYGASAVALLAAVGIAQAQAQERGGTIEQRGESPQGQMQKGQPAQPHAQVQRQPGQQLPGERGQPEQRAQGTEGGPALDRTQQAQPAQGAQHPQGRRAQNENAREDNVRGEEQNRGNPPAATTERGNERNAQGRQQENRSAQGGERARTRVAINIPPQQRTRVRNVIVQDTALRKYHRADVHFALNVGVVVPETFVLYDPPPQLIAITPEFRGFKIVVVDDTILVIDPATREIVDVIEV